MYAWVLIPKSLSLVLQLHPNPANLLEMSAVVWSNLHLTPGTLLHPYEGEVRLDRLEVYGVLSDDDIRRKYGCYDVIQEVDGKKVRYCNWVRFVKTSSDTDKVNIIGSIVKGRPFFQVIKLIKPNEELVVLFRDDSSGTSTSCHEIPQVMMPSPSRHSPPDTSHGVRNGWKEADGLGDTAEEEDDKDSSPETSNQSSCHQLVQCDEQCSGHAQDVSNDESSRWAADMQVSSGEEDSVSSPQETDRDIPQSSETLDPHQHSDNDQCSPREDRVTFCEGLEVAPCTLVSTTTPIPEVPSRLLAASAPSRKRRERTWLPCDTCSKKFDRPSLLKRHIRTHTGEKPYACNVCGKAFSTSSSLNTHRRIHSGEKPHQCPVCGKRFTASSNLYYHCMTHNKEKPHKCQLCPKSFPTPGDLRSHTYIHNGSWPFHCEVCNRGFSKHTNLRNHMLRHTGERPHACPTCGKRFSLRSNLKSHLKTHADEMSSSCAKCGQAFSENLKMVSEGLCSGCSEDSAKASSQKVKEQVTIDSRTDFSIAKLTARSPRAPKHKDPSPEASSISSASSTESISPPCGQFNGHRPWLSPFSSTSSSSLTSPPAMSCVITSVPSLPHYMFLDSTTATSPSVFFAQDMMSREDFMPSARASLPYPAASPWKQQIIAQAF